jgi:60 kDa SS-A/Ro ribonucleoprotein
MSNKTYTDFAAASTTKASKVVTPQTQAIPGREAEMARNNAGGFTFTLDKWGTLDRFIMIGSEGGNYYVGEKDVTKQSFTNALACIAEDGVRAVNRAVEYSVAGRAPKNDPALVVLALAAAKGSPEVQAAAYDALPKVARTGTHLFTFVSILNSMGKWNAAAKRGLSKWYTNRSIEKLAVQMLKYQSRNGWSHRDVLRLAHVKATNEVQNNLFKYVVKGGEALSQGDAIPQLVVDFEFLKRADSAKDVVRLIETNKDISWELVPTQFLKDKDVLMALLPSMGLTAVIRQLGKLTAAGVLDPMSEGSKLVMAKLSDAEALKAQRVHPITILQALKQYSAGHGERGSLVWSPNQRIVDSLNDSFYAAFGTLEKTDAGQYIAVDVSGSMSWDSSKVNGSPNLYARDVAACMAMAIARTSSNYFVGAFSGHIQEMKISPNMRLDDVLAVMGRMSAGSTDCSLPMVDAKNKRMSGVDLFTVITDNETYAGRMQPVQALRDYRNAFNKTAKLCVIATSVSNFTIADPKDAGMMDIAGFDSAAPQIIADFASKR